MIKFWKGFIQYIRGLLKSSISQMVTEYIEPPKPQYLDTYIRFKKAPLIGKVYRHGKKMWRVVGYEVDGNFKCELETI